MLFILAVLIGGSSGCASSMSDVTDGERLVFALAGDPFHLDPNLTQGSLAHTVMMNIFDTLVYADVEGNIHPGLATSWETSDDRLSWTFHLREGVTFHDGTPFNAEAVKFTMDRVKDPELNSRRAASYLGPYISSEVIDEYTVCINFEKPYELLLVRLSRAWLGIVSPTAVKKYGNDGFGEHPVGTGPFIFRERVPNSHIILDRNPDYNWAPSIFDHQGPPHVEGVTFKIVPDLATRLATLENGEVNVIEDDFNQVIGLEL